MVKRQIFRNFIGENQLVMNKIKPFDQESSTGADVPNHTVKVQNKLETGSGGCHIGHAYIVEHKEIHRVADHMP